MTTLLPMAEDAYQRYGGNLEAVISVVLDNVDLTGPDVDLEARARLRAVLVALELPHGIEDVDAMAAAFVEHGLRVRLR